jgi:hypothetical protein
MTSGTRPVAGIAGQHVGHDRLWPKRLVTLVGNAIAVARYHSTPRRPPVGKPAGTVTYHHATAHERRAA